MHSFLYEATPIHSFPNNKYNLIPTWIKTCCYFQLCFTQTHSISRLLSSQEINKNTLLICLLTQLKLMCLHNYSNLKVVSPRTRFSAGIDVLDFVLQQYNSDKEYIKYYFWVISRKQNVGRFRYFLFKCDRI